MSHLSGTTQDEWRALISRPAFSVQVSKIRFEREMLQEATALKKAGSTNYTCILCGREIARGVQRQHSADSQVL